MSVSENLMLLVERQRPLVKAALGTGLLAIVGIGDYLTGFEFTFSLFYVLPIAFMTWFLGRQAGVLTAVVSAIIWLVTDLATGIQYSHLFIPLWNTVIRLAFFLIMTGLMTTVRSILQLEKELARVDYLTGAANSRQFYELLNTEIERSRRNNFNFTLVYIDIDNFKTINDRFGHQTGDLVLNTVASYIKMTLRKMDVVARLGGDEFAILLPQTGLEQAMLILTKLKDGLQEQMRLQHCPVTFSIGAVISDGRRYTAEYLLNMADVVMYSVKHENKDAIKYTQL